MRMIEDIMKAGWQDTTAVRELAFLVGMSLAQDDVTKPLGTGALILRLLPAHTKEQYFALAGLLGNVRKLPECAGYWEYTGKKTRFGKQALQWLPQAIPPEEDIMQDEDGVTKEELAAAAEGDRELALRLERIRKGEL